MPNLTTKVIACEVINITSASMLAFYWMLTRQGKAPASEVFEIETSIELPKPPLLESNVWALCQTAKTIGCADAVFGAWDPQGSFRIITSHRGPDETFPGCDWMHGGGPNPTVETLAKFLLTKGMKEFGVQALVSFQPVYVGTFRTRCDKTGKCTLQPCYFVEVPFEVAQRATTDVNHTGVRLISQNEWRQIFKPHPYPNRVFELVWSAANLVGKPA